MRWRRLTSYRGVLWSALLVVAFVAAVVVVDNGRGTTPTDGVEREGIFDGAGAVDEAMESVEVAGTTTTLPRTTTTRTDSWLSHPLTIDTPVGVWRWTRLVDYSGPPIGAIVPLGDGFIAVEDNSEAFWDAGGETEEGTIDGTAWVWRSSDGLDWTRASLDSRFSGAHLWMYETGGVLWMSVGTWGGVREESVWRSVDGISWDPALLGDIDLPVEGLEVTPNFSVGAIRGDVVVAPAWIEPQIPGWLWEDEYGPGAEPDPQRYWDAVYDPELTVEIIRDGAAVAEVRFGKDLVETTVTVEVIEVGGNGDGAAERVIHTGRATYASIGPREERLLLDGWGLFPPFGGTWVSHDGGHSFAFFESEFGSYGYGDNQVFATEGGFVAFRESQQRYVTRRVSESTTITSLVTDRELLRSVDGVTWETVDTVEFDPQFNGPLAVGSGGAMVATSEQSVLVSADGTEWLEASVQPPDPSNAEYRSAPFGFIGLVHNAFFNPYAAYVSVDGEMWTTITTPPTKRAPDFWVQLVGDTLFWTRSGGAVSEVWIGRFE